MSDDWNAKLTLGRFGFLVLYQVPEAGVVAVYFEHFPDADQVAKDVIKGPGTDSIVYDLQQNTTVREYWSTRPIK